MITDAPAVSTASVAAPSATELEQDLGQLFGDYSSSGESPDLEASAAGTTPAEPATGAEGAETEAEPKAGDDATETPGDGTTPAAAPAAVEDDPFKDTTPAQYVINGQSIPVEDIRVFKEGGAVIRPEALPNVLSKLAERDQLADRMTTRDREYQTLATATEWTDPAGKAYTGPDAAIEMRVGNASLFAENRLIVQAITDPDTLARCLTTVTGPDGVERVVFSEQALNDLRRENALQQREIGAAIRDHYKGVIAESSKPAPAPIDHVKATDALVVDIAKASALDASVLTAADKALLAKQLPFHIQNKQASLEWQELVKDRIALRTEQKAASQKLVTTTTAAVQKGAANLAAAARGMRPTAKAPATPARPASPQSERTQNEGDMYDAMERAAAVSLRSAH